MDQHSERYLHTHRFNISKQSLTLLKSLRKTLPELQKEYKIIQGLSFFGSRTTGLEKENDQNQPEQLGSDLDICVFYDGSVFGNQAQANEPIPKGTLAINHVTRDLKIDRRKSQHQELLNWARYRFAAELQKSVKERIISLMDYKIKQEGESIFIVDISEDATLRSLNAFYNSLQSKEDQFSDENKKLLSRFFLGVGEGLYGNRQFIFDQLKKRSDSNQLLQTLMRRLGEFERTRDVLINKPKTIIIPFEVYPQTIDEAERYFLTRRY